MNNNAILTLAAAAILLLAIHVAVHLNYKKKIKEKNQGILQHIRKQDLLQTELNETKIEKKLLLNILLSKLDLITRSSHSIKKTKQNKQTKINN